MRETVRSAREDDLLAGGIHTCFFGAVVDTLADFQDVLLCVSSTVLASSGLLPGE